jgi:DUF971 family protein
MNSLTPTGITVNRESSIMTIRWSDGIEANYPFNLLRSACPCAECRGGHENMRSEPGPDVYEIPLLDVRATKISSVEAVGNYAIVIEWEDGHRYGIYNWRYLRALWEGLDGHQ